MKHYLVLLSSAPNRPDEFRGICGHESTNAKEFTNVTNPSTKGVDCPACIERLKQSTIIVKETET